MNGPIRILKNNLIMCGAVEVPPGSPMTPPCPIVVGQMDARGRQVGDAQKALLGLDDVETTETARPFVDAVAPMLVAGPGVSGVPEQVGSVRVDPMLTAAIVALWPDATWYDVPGTLVVAAAAGGRVVALVAGLFSGGGPAAAPTRHMGRA